MFFLISYGMITFAEHIAEGTPGGAHFVLFTKCAVAASFAAGALGGLANVNSGKTILTSATLGSAASIIDEQNLTHSYDKSWLEMAGTAGIGYAITGLAAFDGALTGSMVRLGVQKGVNLTCETASLFCRTGKGLYNLYQRCKGTPVVAADAAPAATPAPAKDPEPSVAEAAVIFTTPALANPHNAPAAKLAATAPLKNRTKRAPPGTPVSSAICSAKVIIP